jgi:uncharacterized protein (TIGR02246 family)
MAGTATPSEAADVAREVSALAPVVIVFRDVELHHPAMASRESRRIVMTWHNSTNEDNTLRNRLLRLSLYAGGSVAAVLVGIRATAWTVATLRSWTVATMSAMFISAAVAAQAPGGSASTGSRANPEITAVADAYTRTFLAGDARAVAEMFTTDGYELPPNLPPVKGRTTIEARYHAFFNGPIKMTAFTLSHIEARIDGNTAYDVGTYEQRLSLPDGKSVTDTGKFVVILKRMPGEWKVAYSTYNSDLPAAPCPSHE